VGAPAARAIGFVLEPERVRDAVDGVERERDVDRFDQLMRSSAASPR
jgi:hypothetical protein